MRAIRAGAIVFLLAALVVTLGLLDLGAGRQAQPRAQTRPQPIAESIPEVPPPSPAETANVAPAVVRGTVTGKYGPILGVRVVARSGSAIITETTTDALGRYRFEGIAVPQIEIEACPMPETDLSPARQCVQPRPGEETVADFDLAEAGTARGTVSGGDASVCFDIVAIRAGDYPPGPDPPSIGALEAAPKVGASVAGLCFDEEDVRAWPLYARQDTAFRLDGLDPTATYRLALLNRDWALDSVVFLRAGDERVLAHAVRVLRVFVEARDLETGDPVPRFRVILRNGVGTTLATFEGEDGRASASIPRPAQVRRDVPRGEEPKENVWELVIAADGYAETTCPVEGVHYVSLQRTRAPNLRLRIAYEDHVPLDGEIEVEFESLEDPEGLLKASVRKDAPGLWWATLPRGRWRLHISRPRAFQDVCRVVDVDVPAEGVVEAAQRYVRGGTVTFETSVTMVHDDDGEREQIWVAKGTWDDVPVGTYVILYGGKETSRFTVVAGTAQVVRGPHWARIPELTEPGSQEEGAH
jgi:hypothetical protein